jgi:cysteine synthase
VAQTAGKLHAFVAGAGTGGTIAGVSQVLKRRDPSIRVVLVDPPGSSLYNKVHHCRMHNRTYRLLVPFLTC